MKYKFSPLYLRYFFSLFLYYFWGYVKKAIKLIFTCLIESKW